MSLIVDALLIAAVGVAAWAATALALKFLDRRSILDRPNERSSHRRPTPRGGGIAIVPIIVAAWSAIGIATHAPLLHWVVLALGAGLALVSWIDDVRDLHPGPRFLSHIAAVTVVLILLPGDLLVFQGWLPPMLDRMAAGLAWVWFINLYNFMDGIDGITGVETMSIGGGLAVIAALGGGMTAAGVPITALGLSLAATSAGFLIWNWHPARIFMGDVGSVPTGFLSGWLLIATAASGAWAVAMILPAYYLADATITLARRARRLEPIWRAHREHFYQQAVSGGHGHNHVAIAVGILNLALIGAAALSAYRPLLAVGLASVATAATLFRFSRMGPTSL